MKNVTLSRRKVLQGIGGLAAATMFSGIRLAFASAPVEERFVFFILRGAMDGLNVIPPYGDRSYVSARRGIALADADYQPLDRFFGAHNALVNFTQMYRAGEAAALQAVATPYRERSHFDAQNVLESGGLAPHALRDGWLNRALGLYGAQTQTLGLAVGQTIPLTLQGNTSVTSWAPDAQGMPADTMLLALNRLYQNDAIFHSALAQAVDVNAIASGAMNGADMKGIGKNLRNKKAIEATMTSVGKILADPRGPRIATVEIGGWDTHAQQGPALANNLAALDAGFGALKAALGAHWRKTVVLAATEFGRTVAQNGTNGTDHGTASCALLLGGAVNGGRVVAEWPGLERLYENRDLAPTMDLRQVAKSILTAHLRLPARGVEQNVFPDSANLRGLDGIIRA